MSKTRLYLVSIIGASVVTFGSYQLAHAYSNNAAPTAAIDAAPVSSGQPAQVMDESKTIGQNIAQSSNFVSFSKALTAAGLDAALSGGGPMIVFAPDDAAFSKIPVDKLADLMKPDNKDKLSKILSYHVVAGNLSLHDLEKLGATGNEIPLRSNAGVTLNLKKDNTSHEDKWTVTDETGAVANITKADQKASNGKIYIIDTVLMPKM